MPHEKNLRLDKLTPVDAGADRLEAIVRLQAKVEERALGAIDWYLRRKRAKALASLALRWLTIILVTAGGLTPLVNALLPETDRFDSAIGYVLFGLAAAMLAADRFADLSRGWMRYVATALGLQRALHEFQIGWTRELLILGPNPPGEKDVANLLGMLQRFASLVEEHVGKETEAWIAEFHANLAALEKVAQAKLESNEPGAVHVRIDNVADAAQGASIAIDGRAIAQNIGSASFLLPDVGPGHHVVEVTGVDAAGGILRASELVVVRPRETATAAVHLQR